MGEEPMADVRPGRRKWEPRRNDRRRGDRRYPDEPPADMRPPRARIAAEVAVERNLIRLLLMHPHLIAQVAERVDPASIGEPHLLEIYLAVLAHGEEGFDAIQATLSPAAVELHVLLVQEESPIISREATTKQVDDFLGGILAQREVFDLDRRLADVQAALRKATDAEKDALTREKMELFKRRQQLSRSKFKVF